MAKHGSGAFKFLLVNGYDLLASALQGVNWKRGAKTENAHGLGDTAELPTPVGIATYTLSQSGAFFNDAASGAHGLLAAGATAASRVVCFAVAGNSVGAPFVGCLGALTVAYEVIPQNGALTKANAEYQITGHAYDGQIVQPWETKTADWNTVDTGVVDYATDPSQTVIPITSASKAATCVVTTTVPHGLTTGQVIMISGNTLAGPAINGELPVTVTSTTTFTVAVNTTGCTGAGTGGSLVRCSTVGGAYGVLQVSACSGFTNFVGSFLDSADGATYASLITFTDNVTAPYAQTATNGAEVVNRYVCFLGNVTGTGSITCMSGLARL